MLGLGNRYISIACNECKRRKIKCNGETPCQRCGNLNLECAYAPNCCNSFKDSDEFKQMSTHITSLQQQVDDLFQNLNALRAQVDVQSNGSIGTPFNPDYQQTPMLPPQSARSRSKSFSKHPRFHGPTSNAFNVGVARSSLKTMGINAGEEGEDDGELGAGAEGRAGVEGPDMVHLQARGYALGTCLARRDGHHVPYPGSGQIVTLCRDVVHVCRSCG